MKKLNIKIPKVSIDFAKKMPYIFVGFFLIIGMMVLFFGYLLFSREPESSVKTAAAQEIDSLFMHLSIKKMEQLFDSGYNANGIKNPGYKTKNPFVGF